MPKLNQFFALCALVVGLLGFVPAMAQVDRSLEGDKNCTVCHDESWRVPVLSIYQTKHGVKADTRTPGCQSCHGASAEHQSDPGNKSPDVVFGAKSKKISSAEARNAACLTCHESRILPRTNWSGSQHETRGVACSDCHEAHVGISASKLAICPPTSGNRASSGSTSAMTSCWRTAPAPTRRPI